MTVINRNLYATQDIVPRRDLEAGYPDRIILAILDERLDDLFHSARDKNETLDWATLTISTRFDALIDGLLISCRVNAQ